MFEGGILQVFHRISTPEALAWTEQTRGMFGGMYSDYAFGELGDRCFAMDAGPGGGDDPRTLPLADLRVVDLSTVLAGPGSPAISPTSVPTW